MSGRSEKLYAREYRHQRETIPAVYLGNAIGPI